MKSAIRRLSTLLCAGVASVGAALDVYVRRLFCSSYLANLVQGEKSNTRRQG